MSKEKPASYYEDHFSENIGFQVHYKSSHYYVPWTQVIVFLRKIRPRHILEIGCGTGQLAEYLRDEGFTSYEGFDFAPKAVAMARQRVEMNFYIGDALNKELYAKDFSVAICLEVLEHVKRDHVVLGNIPAGKEIIFSVPNFDAPSHVRWFTSERQIKKRYFRQIDIKEIIPIGNLYICRGIISPFKPSVFQYFLATRAPVGLSSFWVRIKHRVKNFFKLKFI